MKIQPIHVGNSHHCLGIFQLGFPKQGWAAERNLQSFRRDHGWWQNRGLGLAGAWCHAREFSEMTFFDDKRKDVRFDVNKIRMFKV